MIGYDTQNDPALKATLDRMAQAGDTGDTAHRPVENEQTLQDALSDIAGRTVTCEFALSHMPQDVHKVQVRMSGKQVNLDETNGWSLSQDGRSITLNGSSCTAMKTGNYTLSVREVCNVVQPI